MLLKLTFFSWFQIFILMVITFLHLRTETEQRTNTEISSLVCTTFVLKFSTCHYKLQIKLQSPEDRII